MKIVDKIKRKGIGASLRRFDEMYGIGRLERALASNWFNPFATLWINFRMLPFKQAIHFPIYVYGRPRIYGTSGQIRFDCPVKRKLVTFNRNQTGAPSLGSAQSEFFNAGLIIFHGRGQIDTGVRFWVSHTGKVEIGSEFKISDMTNFSCYKSVKLGNRVRIAHRCQIFDNNFHYVANLNRGAIPSYLKGIEIGNNVWVCNSTTVNAGAKIPDFVIVSSNSHVSKDFSDCKPGTVIGGIPAKVIGSGSFRVENKELANQLWDYYHQEPEPPLFDMNAHNISSDDIVEGLSKLDLPG